MTDLTLPLDGYVRVSVRGGRELRGEGSGDAPELRSVPVQEAKIRELCKANGGDPDTMLIEVEINKSGGKQKAGRPKLDRLVERIRNHESRGIVIYKLTRLSRLGLREHSDSSRRSSRI
jgi:DNA invertase Pin-like site-specific DNA recombinase